MRLSDRRHVRLNDYSRRETLRDQIILFHISDLRFCVKKKKELPRIRAMPQENSVLFRVWNFIGGAA